MNNLKKLIFIILVFMLCVSVEAKSQNPKYKIISNSYKQEDINEMYEIKNELLIDYKEWVKGVDNPDQALADHQDDYHATFKQGVYTIILGDGLGKSLTGDLKVNYCETTKDLKSKSLIWDWLFWKEPTKGFFL